MTRANLPAQQEPVIDGGAFTLAWRRLFEALWTRSGGAGDTITTVRMTIKPTSNTNARISYVGTDGTTRSADITLS